MFLDLFSYKWTKMIEMGLIEGQTQKVKHMALQLLQWKEENPDNGQRSIKALYKECIALSECRALWDRKYIYGNPQVIQCGGTGVQYSRPSQYHSLGIQHMASLVLGSQQPQSPCPAAV